METSPFTLQIGAAEKSLAAWGLAQPQIALNSLAQSFLTLTAPGAAVDATPIAAFEQQIILRKKGVQVFRGLRVDYSSRGNGQSESASYSFADPWYWLDNLTFEQEWHSGNNSHVILCMDDTGHLIRTGAQIIAALQFAISKGAPITIGDIEPGIFTYFNERTDMPVSEVVRACAHYSQPCVAFFDYSTALPTFHLVRRSNAVAVSMPFVPTPLRLMEEIDIRPCPELVRPSVNLRFEITSQVNNQPVFSIRQQNAGSDTPGLRSLVATISLQGPSVAITTAEIETVPCTPLIQAWWQDRRPEAMEGEVTFSRCYDRDTGEQIFPEFELISGQVADWFPEDIITARARL
jgi:hypothetical protein